MAAGALALLATACGSAVATAPASSHDQSQTSRQAYAKMLAEENHDPQGQKTNNDLGESDHCIPVTLAASPPSPQTSGVSVTLTAAATKCPKPSFEFWLRRPGGAWSVLQAFSLSNTATWKTSGLAAGTYSLDVWAKKVGSDVEDVQISSIASYTLAADPPASTPTPTPTPAPLPASTACASVTWNQPNPAAPQAPGTRVTLSGTAGGCPNPVFEFWVQPAAGTWTILQAYGTSSTATWDTIGLTAGTYSFDIWVKGSGSASQWEAHLSPNPTYLLQAGAACTSVSWNPPSPADPQAPGVAVTLSGVAAGCPNPQYQFWILPPTGGWTILQAYSSSSSLVWHTGLPTGSYLFDIWVRQLGSAASWEAHISPNPTYTIQTGPPCTSSALTFSPASPSSAGTSVQLSAVATGCPNPTYEYWVLGPTGSWTVLQGYSSSSTATWSTTGLAPGTYQFDVWVRQAGNSPDWEAHISPNPTYTLT